MKFTMSLLILGAAGCMQSAPTQQGTDTCGMSNASQFISQSFSTMPATIDGASEISLIDRGIGVTYPDVRPTRLIVVVQGPSDEVLSLQCG